MIFAHGPAGLLVTEATKKLWSKKIHNKKISKYILLGAFFALAVDFDLFFTWLVDASHSHHEYVTHTIFLPLLGLIPYVIARLLKNEKLKAISIIYSISTFSHLLLDSIPGTIMWLYPYSREFIGLTSFDEIASSTIGKNILFINISLELLIVLASLNTWIKKYTKIRFKNSIIATLSIGWGALVFILFFIAQNTYQPGGNEGIKDIDKDGVSSFADLDIDGDGIANIKDEYPYNDQVSTENKIINSIKDLNGVNFDPSSGRFYEFTRRAGFFNEKDVIEKAYNQAGIFLDTEIRNDAKGGNGYVGGATNSDLTFKIENYIKFFEVNNYIIANDSNLRNGDIVFIRSSYFPQKIIGGIITVDQQEQVKVTTFNHQNQKVETSFLSDVELREGSIFKIARIIQ